VVAGSVNAFFELSAAASTMTVLVYFCVASIL